MAKVTVCDICGRKSSEVDGYMRQFKCRFGSGLAWDKYDICSDCTDEIRQKIRKGGKDEK